LRGAKLLTGGTRVQDGECAKGYFIAPTVLEATNDMKIAQTEVFGPVLCVIRFRTKKRPFKSPTIRSMVWRPESGPTTCVAPTDGEGDSGRMIWVNTYRSMASQTPFGGYKLSGYGKERGEEALLEYTQMKNITMDLSSDVYDQYTMRG